MVERAGYAAGYGVLLGNSSWAVDQEREYVQMLLAKQIDGIVLAAATVEVTALDEILARSKWPWASSRGSSVRSAVSRVMFRRLASTTSATPSRSCPS
ncbi:MAG: hypothetical protein IPO81_07580 [Kouleothrix sp.]|nr:hypothetical protein [Kouleothrix sp.]